MTNKIIRIDGIIVVLLLMVFSSCKKYNNPPAVFEDTEDHTSVSVKRKVLLISVDGAVGSIVKQVTPPNIKALLETSKYTFDGLADEKTLDATTWMTMMSGVTYAQHHIENNSFIPSPDEDDPHANVKLFPSLFYRISTIAPGKKTYVVARDNGVTDRLLNSATESDLSATDEEVKNTSLQILKTKSADCMVVQFKDVQNAGVSSGFSASNANYVNALNKTDGYIGEIITGLKNRQNYKNEDWLIIITSNHGGVDHSFGGGSSSERNIFAIFENPKFKKLELKSDIIKSFRFFGFYDNLQANYAYYDDHAFRARNNPVLAKESIYNANTTGELTIEAKIRMNAVNGSYGYAANAPLLGKNAQRYGSTPGWAFFKQGGALMFYLADGSTKIESSMGAVSSNGEWAHISAVIKKVNNVPTAILYVNGMQVASVNNPSLNMNNTGSATGLTFGYFPYIFSGLPNDAQICDVQIWNKALSSSEVDIHANRMGPLTSELTNTNLVGYWPMDDLVNNAFKNTVAGNPDIGVQGSSRLTIESNSLPYADPNNVFFQSQDLFTQIFYWLELKTQDNWGLEGTVFLNKYEIEFLDSKN